MSNLKNLMTKSLNKAFQEINPSTSDEMIDKSRTLASLKNEIPEGQKEESKEATGAASAGAYVGPLFGPMKKERKSGKKQIKGGPVTEEDVEGTFDKVFKAMKKDSGVKESKSAKQQFIDDLKDDPDYVEFKKNSKKVDMRTGDIDQYGTPNVTTGDDFIEKKKYSRVGKEDKPRKEEAKEATTSASAGVYDAPFGGPKKDPLKLSNPKTVEKELRSVKDKKFPKFGGPGGKYVRIKDKCKKFPYCNQGDIGALEFFEQDSIKEAIENIALKTTFPINAIKSIILHELEEKTLMEQDDTEFQRVNIVGGIEPKSDEEIRKEWLNSIPDKKVKYLKEKFEGKTFEFKDSNLSGKIILTSIGPVGKIGFFSHADDMKFQEPYVEVHVKLEELNFNGQKVPIGFYNMISRYIPPEEEESSYRGDPVETAVLSSMSEVEDVCKYLSLKFAKLVIDPYTRFDW